MDHILRGKSSISSNRTIILNNKDEFHKVLTQDQIIEIKKVFLKNESKLLNSDELRSALHKHIQIFIPEKMFQTIFLQMNISQTGSVSWDEFITFLIISYNHADAPLQATSLEAPISKDPKIFKSHHRHPISCISFNYHINNDRTISYDNGWYVTLSKDGIINYWSMDFELKKSMQAKSPDIKITEPLILCMTCLPDVNVIAAGSNQRDIRFYDTSAQKFALRVHFVSLEFSITCMTYVYSEDVNLDAKLLFGDTSGNVFVLYFSPLSRGPFRSVMGMPILTAKFCNVLQGLYPKFVLIEYKALHNDWVKQIKFLPTQNAILSCSPSPPSLVLTSFCDNGTNNVYKLNRGVWCFVTTDTPPLICTGSADGLVRVWNPYIFTKPIEVLRGHHAGIVGMILQDDLILCSISMDRTIRIWNLKDLACIQIYALGSSIGESTEVVMFYNYQSRQILIGGNMLVVLSLRPKMSFEQSDGYSHTAGISVLLYNPLFRKVVSCGLDSRIILWDPFNGKRILVINNAHTRSLHGQVIPVDITAGTFDIGYQYLLTGAFDGTLKTWHMNTGTCLRNLHIEDGSEVTGVCWPKNRILAIGWNRYVTEFPEGDLRLGASVLRKSWSIKHTGDVLFAAAKIPEALATCTYNGELVFWALETGQPYKIYSVANPSLRIKVTFDFNDKKETTKLKPRKCIKAKMIERIKSTKTIRPSMAPIEPFLQSTFLRESNLVGDIEINYINKLNPPPTITPIRGLAVRCMIYLESRKTDPVNATLLVALENGDIQAWSHHPSGRFLKAFQATHTIGDYVVAMATDINNEYLFAGSTEGYIKAFLIKGYLTKKKEDVILSQYRLKFPFMWKSFFAGRAERNLTHQKYPVMLNSYKAHRGIVSGLVYLDENELIISSSSDWSIRIWTLAGRYVNTLGTFKPWQDIPPDEPINNDFKHTLPTDLRTIMSSTSYKVFMGTEHKKKLTKKQEAALSEKEYMLREDKIFGQRLGGSILGNHIRMSETPMKKYEFQVKPIGNCIPIYQNLLPVNIRELPEIKKPSTSHQNPPMKAV